MKFLHSLLTLSQFSLQASQFASWTVFRTFRSRCILIEYTAKPESLHSEKVNIIISQFQFCWLRLPPHLPHVFMQFIFIHLLLWQLFQYFEQSKQNYTEHKVGPAHVMCHVYLYQAPEANLGNLDTPMYNFENIRLLTSTSIHTASSLSRALPSSANQVWTSVVVSIHCPTSPSLA